MGALAFWLTVCVNDFLHSHCVLQAQVKRRPLRPYAYGLLLSPGDITISS